MNANQCEEIGNASEGNEQRGERQHHSLNRLKEESNLDRGEEIVQIAGEEEDSNDADNAEGRRDRNVRGEGEGEGEGRGEGEGEGARNGTLSKCEQTRADLWRSHMLF
jgi:hypothetical protein